MSFHDISEIKVSTDTVNKLSIGQCIKSSERPIIGSKNLRWAFHLTKTEDYFFWVDLWVSNPVSVVKAKGMIQVGSADPYKKTFDVQLNQTNNVNLIIGNILHWLGANGFIKVNVTFTGYEEEPGYKKKHHLPNFTIDDFIKASNHYTPDARIVVGKDVLDVHRHILCLISPVFHAEFTHDTKEAKTGTINIKDFDFATVKNVIDTCYGRECTADSLVDFMDMLRFADKYDIRTVAETIVPFLDDDLTLDSFCAIANYAWDLDKTDLKLKCAKFYRDNVAQITFCPEFVNMNPATIVDIIRLGASIDS
uniref:BTB domain-containing protein n=1 Tax=Panagrellus redivivus TaxID=6233 RepID=A0A7E4W8T2_PANRE